MPEVGAGREGVVDVAGAALASLEANRSRIDDLNVYPVPDGDTGTNMTLTVRAVTEALDRDPEADVGRAVLMGARGNSGVILSQLVRGALENLPADGPLDGAAVAGVLRGASDAGYAAVRNPVEGTILTVARALADRAEELASADMALGDRLNALLASGDEALERTTEQLDVLRQAGVVDAGAAGLVEVLRGIASHVRGEPLPEPAVMGEPIPLDAVHQELSRFRYCTSFFVEGDGVDPERLEEELGRLGDSLLVVGAPGAVKVHVHTDDPGAALGLATAVGVIEEVDVKNMHVQTAEREERLLTADLGAPAVCGVVAVCAGEGNRRLVESLGAVSVEGGQSMNPATADIVAAVEALHAGEAVVLPNNKNVTLAAEQAAAASAKPVRVVPTRSLQEGLGALVAFDPGLGAAENAAAMEEAAAGVRSGAVTRASRDAVVGDLEVEEGQYLGLLDGEPVSAGPVLQPVAREVLERLLEEGGDVLTILAGQGAEGVDDLVGFVREEHPELELEVHDGGQPHYPLLFSVE
ncbi:MAG TPA: DAK2 domain-containing protein [Gaiellaceae bacterium]|nr:DAK2 domain-containing protein [Gaiellaceae bacterium]